MKFQLSFLGKLYQTTRVCSKVSNEKLMFQMRNDFPNTHTYVLRVKHILPGETLHSKICFTRKFKRMNFTKANIQ